MGKTKATKRLPNKPSALIRLALRDLAKVERNKKYVVNMELWHDPFYSGTDICSVCFAGGVMACTLKTRRNITRTPEHFPDKVRLRLRALNEFRDGFVRDGLLMLGAKEYWRFKNRDTAFYNDDPAQFKADMKTLAADLQKAGL